MGLLGRYQREKNGYTADTVSCICVYRPVQLYDQFLVNHDYALLYGIFVSIEISAKK